MIPVSFLPSSDQTQKFIEWAEFPIASSGETIIYFCNRNYAYLTAAEEHVQEWELK